MPHDHFDTIVIGLGAVGSATLYQLARRGAKVLGLDQYAPPHSLGSSHGQTRITRLAVGEGDEYVPLVRRSHEIWRELEAATGQSIYTRTHGLVLGPRDGAPVHQGRSHDFVHSTIDIARRHGIDHEVLDHADLRRRYPQFQLNDHADAPRTTPAVPNTALRPCLLAPSSAAITSSMHRAARASRSCSGTRRSKVTINVSLSDTTRWRCMTLDMNTILQPSEAMALMYASRTFVSMRPSPRRIELIDPSATSMTLYSYSILLLSINVLITWPSGIAQRAPGFPMCPFPCHTHKVLMCSYVKTVHLSQQVQ